jgi:lipopolysaccharide transport system ATP-binding protein
MYYVSAFCQRALWLRRGRVAALGPVAEVVRDYENFLVAKSARAAEAASSAVPGTSKILPARIVSARLLETGQDSLYGCGDPWELTVEWEAEDPGLAFHLGVGINRIDEVEVCSFATHLDGLPPQTGERTYAARLRIPRLPLVKGEFTLYIFLMDEEGLHIYDQKRIPGAFTVHSASYAFGLVRADHAWDLTAGIGSSVPRSVARASP